LQETVQFLRQHGYVLLFWWVLAEQLGLPVPSAPLMAAAGALAGAGDLSLGLSLLIAAIASLFGDSTWYYFGRVRGGRVLGLLCRLSMEPDSCVRRTENVFERHGPRSLLVAKFIPGFSTVAPPMAGITDMPWWRFLLFDGAGSLLWASSFMLTGYIFSGELEKLGVVVAHLGHGFMVLVLLAFAAWVYKKHRARVRFQKELMEARVTPQEVKSMMDAGEPLTILDLRHPLDFLPHPQTLPGAIRMSPADVEKRKDEIPADGEIILYCT